MLSSNKIAFLRQDYYYQLLLKNKTKKYVIERPNHNTHKYILRTKQNK